MKNIKVSLLKSTLHESNMFSKENEKFINNIGLCGNFNITVSDIDDYDCDLKLIFIASGGSEGIFLKNIQYLKEPYYILTNGTNNSLAASLEILTYLNNNNLNGEVLHGDLKYITDRINSLVDKKEKEDYPRLGVIGNPSDWLISSVPKYKDILNKFKIELVDIPLSEIVDIYKKTELINSFNSSYFDNTELSKADAVYKACKLLVEKYKLEGFTIRCFDLLDDIKMTGCLALAKLNSEGIIGTCEGDIMAMITMYLVKNKFNQSSFQCNPSIIDVNSNKIIFAHCTCPFDMFTSYKYDSHFESKIGVALKGELKEEDVTVFRISSNMKSYYIGEGTILRNLDNKSLCRTQIELSMRDDISILLKNPCGNHHIVFYGRHKDEINKLMNELFK